MRESDIIAQTSPPHPPGPPILHRGSPVVKSLDEPADSPGVKFAIAWLSRLI
jgi:hypothetical protein